MSDDLAGWLLARIAEDEAAARAAIVGEGRWLVDGSGCCVTDAGDEWIGPHASGMAPHIARHDPARVLAECDARRRIVEALGPPHFLTGGSGVAFDRTLRLLALPYRDHPGYRTEWAI